ncbi:MAG TPA: HNH endonuclease [Polyangia bacterium]
MNHGNSTEAAYVRDLLILAGYQLEGGRAAPRLRATWPTKPLVPRAGLDSDLRERLLARIREANGLGKAALMNRQRADRCLSIDHIVPISHRWRGSCLDASNLQFMNQRDNSTKSDRFNL